MTIITFIYCNLIYIHSKELSSNKEKSANLQIVDFNAHPEPRSVRYRCEQPNSQLNPIDYSEGTAALPKQKSNFLQVEL